jgi:hypothetical protein
MRGLGVSEAFPVQSATTKSKFAPERHIEIIQVSNNNELLTKINMIPYKLIP